MLAGGRSSRFGSDKALAMLDGRQLIDRAAALMAPLTDAVVAVGGPARGSLPVVQDRPGPGFGPLGGIAGALHAAMEGGFAGVLTIPCDTPALPDGLLAELTRSGPSFCTQTPVIGYWMIGLYGSLMEQLSGHLIPEPASASERKHSSLSVKAWARRIGAIPITAGGPIANVNTPADLAGLRR